jgi:5-formyltetrahydrofolate cyclo-ligase
VITINTKKALRERLLGLLRQQKEDSRFKKSRAVLRKLFETREFKKATTVMFFSSFDGEVQTIDMMRQAQNLGKRIALPVTIKKENNLIPRLIKDLDVDLCPGPYGVSQPCASDTATVDLDLLDLVLVPGLAFDGQGNRLGRGKGYYDRFLKCLPKTTPCFGLAFDFQVVPCLPSIEEHDVPVSCVITN